MFCVACSVGVQLAVKDFFNMRVDSWQHALHLPLNPYVTTVPTHGALTLARSAIHIFSRVASIKKNKSFSLTKDYRNKSLRLKMSDE
jgi:hypothetical protein